MITSDAVAISGPTQRRRSILLLLVACLLFELIGWSALRFHLERQLGMGARFWLAAALAAIACVFLWICAATILKRRGWFTLKEFLLGVLLIGALCGFAGKLHQKTLNQRRIADLLTKLGAQVYFGGLNEPGFKQLIGNEYFYGVQRVWLINTSITPEEMSLLSELPELNTLQLHSTQFSDDHLRCLEHVPALKTLALFGGQFSDAALKPLRGHPNLEELHLSSPLAGGCCEILPTLPKLRVLRGYSGPSGPTSQSIAAIGQCKRLEYLILFYPRGTIADFTPLAGLSHLKDLSISGDPSGTAADLEPIGRIVSLERLELDGAWVSDEGIAHIGQLPNLVTLHLSQPALTDAGVVHLERLKKLKNLSLQGSNVTSARILELKQTLPGLEVTRF